jgi:hypothetical protein
MKWQPINSAPFDRDVELAVINGDGEHALSFPNTREWLVGIIPYAIWLYFLFHHEQFMKVVEWLARLVR